MSDIAWETSVSGPQFSFFPPRSSRAGTTGSWHWSACLLAICLIASLVAFSPTALAMVQTWLASRTYSHCFLILPMFAYLVRARRGSLSVLGPGVSFWGLVFVAVLSALWLLGNLAEARVVQEFALLGILQAISWALLGTAVVRRLYFPLLLLWLAIPFGSSLVGPLQDFTARFAVYALRFSNVLAVLENRTILLPGASWTVAETCSGIRYLFSSLALSAFYASLMYRSRKRQLLFMSASIVVPVIANGVRAYGIVLLGYLTSNRLAIGVDHIVYGAVFFIAVQAVLLALGFRWREPRIQHAALEVGASSGAVSGWPKRQLFAAAAVLACVSVAPRVADYLWSRSAGQTGEEPSLQVDPSWRAMAVEDRSWIPDLHNPDKELSQAYESGNDRVDLYWAFYSGRHRMELVGSANRFAASTVWSLTADKHVEAPIAGQNRSIQQSLIKSGLGSRSVWTFYWVGGEYTASPVRVKLLEAKARLLGKPADATIISLAQENRPGSSDSEVTVLEKFLAHASISFAVPVVNSPAAHGPD